MGTAREAMLNFATPMAAMIHPVRVVPMLAPMMTPMPWVSESRPAFTKVISITVVADEDWTATVTRVPDSTAIRLFFVMKLRVFWSFSPAALCMPSLVRSMPYIKRARPPNSFRNIVTIAIVTFLGTSIVIIIFFLKMAGGYRSTRLYAISFRGPFFFTCITQRFP